MADSASSTGQILGHYRVLEKLGAGGMGVVYKALDLTLQRTVALKFLPEDAALDQQEKEHLLAEARAASALDHPNIGAIYGIEEHQHQLFIVMAYYEGETLVRFLTREQSTAAILDILIQVARGLSAAHSRNIIHRDIKPSNIIVTRDGVAKIVDFGLAKVIATSSMTQSLKTSGTLPYMAPEQILGEPVAPACDVWALGIILVEGITKHHPFSRESNAAMSFAIVNQPPSGLENLPSSLQAIAYKALAKEVAYRYPSGKEILPELQAARAELGEGGAPVSTDAATRTNAVSRRELREYAERASASRWTPPKSKKSRWPIYAAILAVLLMVAFYVIRTLRPPRESTSTSTPAGNHIAVLPFDNLSGDPANDALAAGLMDTLSGELSNINAGQQTLWVVPASVVRSRKIADPSTAARELGVNLVVKGSIQRSGQDTHLTVDLIDAHNLREIGSAALEDRTGDFSSLQNEAVARLASLMNIHVTADMLRNTGGRASPAAYELYLKALGNMQRYDKPGNLDQAIAALNDAVKIDPQFALGFASLGESYRLKNQVDPNEKWVRQAMANLQHASELNDRLPGAYVSLAQLHSGLGQHDLALQEYQKALAINPRSPEAMMGIARAYERMGRLQDAEDNFKRAVALRPDFWDGYNSLGFFYFRQNRFPEAVAQFKHVLELTPDNATAYSNLAGVYVRIGDANSLTQAEAALKKSIELSPSYAAYANLGQVYYTQKRYADSAQATRKALELNDQDYAVWQNLLNAYEWMHDDKGTQDALSRAMPLLQQYVAAHPQDAGSHSGLANFYAQQKNTAKAQQEIATALALQPNDSGVLADVADAYELMGDRKRAIAYAEKSLAAGGTLDDLQSRPDMQSLLQDPGFGANKKAQ